MWALPAFAGANLTQLSVFTAAADRTIYENIDPSGGWHGIKTPRLVGFRPAGRVTHDSRSTLTTFVSVEDPPLSIVRIPTFHVLQPDSVPDYGDVE